MQQGTQDFHRILDEFKSQIGNYDLMWNIMRARARRTGSFPHKIYKYVLRYGNRAKPYFIGQTSAGIKFLGDYRDSWAANHAAMPDFDVHLQQFLRQEVERAGGAYLDLGSNLGIVAASVAVALQGRDEVLAFEPVPDTARRAAATFALNNLTNVRLFQNAVGDQDCTITFYEAPGNSQGGSGHADKLEMPAEMYRKIDVSCRSIDSLMAEGAIPEKVGMIKIDVEGNEPGAVRGALKLLERDKPTLLYEYYPSVAAKIGWKATDVAAMIAGLGYRSQVLHDDNSLTAFPPPEDSEEIVDIYCSVR